MAGTNSRAVFTGAAKFRLLLDYIRFLGLLLAMTAFSCAPAEQPKEEPISEQPVPDYGIRQAGAEPLLFGEGTISTPDYEFNTAFAPDDQTVFFSKSDARLSYYAIVFSRLENGVWTAPDIAPFSGFYRDADPAFDRKNKRLYFTSDRPRFEGDSRTDFDIWYVEYGESGWGAAKNAGDEINTLSNEYYPYPVADGSLYLASDRTGGQGFDVYRSQFINNMHLAPLRLSEAINSGYHETDACVDSREGFIVFTSYGRPDSRGQAGINNGDLYISFKKNDVWTPAINIGESVNSGMREFCPAFSPDGKYLFFSSDRGFWDSRPAQPLTIDVLQSRLRGPLNGLGNIFVMETSALRDIVQQP